MSEYYQGRVLEVTEVTSGSELTVDHLAGATVIQVYNADVFESSGGQLWIDQEIYTYSPPADGVDQLTIDPPLVTDAEADLQVFLYPFVVEKRAMVDITGASEDAVMVRVPHALYDALDEVIREASTQESVRVTQELNGDWVLHDVIGSSVTRDGSYIDPGTLPEPEGPIAPPGTVQITVQGMATSILVRTVDIEASTVLEYHISTVDGFTPDSSTLVAETSSVINVVTSLADGTPLLPDTVYYFRVIAKNIIGPAPASDQVSGGLDLSVPADYIMNQVVAGFLLAGTIQVGGDNITIDANDGIRIRQADGGIIHFPRDGSSAKITAELVARSLVVENGADIFGDSLLSGNIRLGAFIEDPKVAPQITTSYEQLGDFGVDVSGYSLAGLIRNVEDTGWITFGNNSSNTPRRIHLYDNGTVEKYNYYSVNTAGGIHAVQRQVRGAVRLGNYYYVLYRSEGALAGSGFGEWAVTKYDSNWDSVITEFVGDDISNSDTYWMALGRSDTEIRIIYNTTGNNLAFGRWNSDTLAFIGASTLDTSWTPEHLAGYYNGSADFGGVRHAIARHSNTALIYTGADAQDTAQQWSNNGENIRGLHYDGTSFYTITYYGKIYKLSSKVTSSNIDVTYTYQTDTGSYTTARSPIKNYTWPARARINVTADPAPEEGSAEPNAADTIAVWAGNAGGTRYLQAVLAIGDRVWDNAQTLTLSGTTEPTTNTFETVSIPGRLFSSKVDPALDPYINLKGDGSGRVGGHEWDADGGIVPGSDGWHVKSVRASAQSIPNDALTTLTGWANDINTISDLGISYSAGIFTFSKPGIYHITIRATFAAPSSGANRRILSIIKNGTTEDRGEWFGVNTSAVLCTNGTLMVLAGNTIQFQAYQNGGAAMDLTSMQAKFFKVATLS